MFYTAIKHIVIIKETKYILKENFFEKNIEIINERAY